MLIQGASCSRVHLRVASQPVALCTILTLASGCMEAAWSLCCCQSRGKKEIKENSEYLSSGQESERKNSTPSLCSIVWRWERLGGWCVVAEWHVGRTPPQRHQVCREHMEGRWINYSCKYNTVAPCLPAVSVPSQAQTKGSHTHSTECASTIRLPIFQHTVF